MLKISALGAQLFFGAEPDDVDPHNRSFVEKLLQFLRNFDGLLHLVTESAFNPIELRL
jgi:hypothetical protein